MTSLVWTMLERSVRKVSHGVKKSAVVVRRHACMASRTRDTADILGVKEALVAGVSRVEASADPRC